jgi:hypothetical protein
VHALAQLSASASAVRDTELEIHHERSSPANRAGQARADGPDDDGVRGHDQRADPGDGVGAIVGLEFTANYKTRPALRLVEIEKLPSTTPLQLP